jgi:signal transduction histidine kinase
LEDPQHETQESLDRLRSEVESLRTSRRRLVLAADADRRRIERELHDGPQQHLVALAVNLQLARRIADQDPAATAALLDEMGRDVQEALDGTRKLAELIYPPLLESGGLGVALRSAADSAGIQTSVYVAPGAYPAEVAGTVYFCCVEALERMGRGAHSAITVREEEGALVFDVVGGGAGSDAATAEGHLSRLRDRLEALGGGLNIASEPGGGARVSGSLPLPEG